MGHMTLKDLQLVGYLGKYLSIYQRNKPSTKA